MRKLLFATVAATTLVATIPASAQVLLGAGPDGAGVQRDVPSIVLVKDDSGHGGIDIGPLGQCFDPRVCGTTSAAYANNCPLVRERIVTQSGKVIFRRHRVCN